MRLSDRGLGNCECLPCLDGLGSRLLAHLETRGQSSLGRPCCCWHDAKVRPPLPRLGQGASPGRDPRMCLQGKVSALDWGWGGVRATRAHHAVRLDLLPCKDGVQNSEFLFF